MKISEAREIVSTMVTWQFVLMGYADKPKDSVDLSKYSLSEIIKANQLVSNRNKVKSNIIEYHEGLGRTIKSRKMQITVDDRVIAGVYFALNYPADGEVKVLIGDKGVGVVNVKSIK